MGQPDTSKSRNADLGFYRRVGKRYFDLVLAAVSLFLLLPLFLVIVVLVKVTSAGPVLFRQIRVGQGQRKFEVLKFRSMRNGAHQAGPGITSSGDPRVTSVGKVLRKTKLDELPQLWNVLRGDMSIVGPRPEIPKYVQLYDSIQCAVFSVLPGITDPASIVFRHEETILAQQKNPEKFYVSSLMPAKLQLNLQYIRDLSFITDLRVTMATVREIIRWKDKDLRPAFEYLAVHDSDEKITPNALQNDRSTA